MKPSVSDEGGFALAALIIFVTAVSIVLAASVPVYRVQAQRELEEELIFRGQEYVRAIQKYQRQVGIFPPSIDALMETNGIRYLRRAYTDPITGDSFRLLTVNADGTINGSTLLQAGANPSLFQGGTPQIFGGAGNSPTGNEAGDNGRGGGNAGGGTLQGDSGFGQQQGFGPPGSGQTNFGQAIAPNGGGFQAPGGGGQAGRGTGGGLPGQTQQGRGQAGGQGGTQDRDGGGAGSSQPLSSGGVVGVAPTNEGRSLKVYNQREIYSEWEFVAIPGFGTIPAATSVPGQVSGQPPGFGGDPSPPSSGGQPNPFN